MKRNTKARKALSKNLSKRIWFVYFAGLGPNMPLFNAYVRPWLLRRAGIQIGAKPKIHPGIYVSGGELIIGNNVFINMDCRFACGGGIHIGSNTQIGPRVSFETANHQLIPTNGIRRFPQASPIMIAENVWIGSNAVILPGVAIGEGAVIGAGAVVTKNVEPLSLVGGVPAKLIRMLDRTEG